MGMHSAVRVVVTSCRWQEDRGEGIGLGDDDDASCGYEIEMVFKFITLNLEVIFLPVQFSYNHG